MVGNAGRNDFVDFREGASEMRRKAIRAFFVRRFFKVSGFDENPIEFVFADEFYWALYLVSVDEAFAAALVRIGERFVFVVMGTIRVAAKIECAAVIEAEIFERQEKFSFGIRH